MKNIFLFVATFWIVNAVQGKVVIHGKVFSPVLKLSLHYHVPINGVTGYIFDRRSLSINDGRFTINAEIDKEGFLSLFFPGKLIVLYVSPNDSIKINVHYSYDSVAKKLVFQKFDYSGPNKSGIELINFNPDYLNIFESQTDIFLKKYNSVEDFYDASIQNLNKLLHPLDSLYSNKEITGKFYKSVSHEIQGNYIYGLFGIFNFLTKGKNLNFRKSFVEAKANNREILTDPNYKALKAMYYANLTPVDSLYQSTLLGKSYYLTFIRDIAVGGYHASIAYDSSFLSLTPEFHFLGYMQGPLQENTWAGELFLKAATEKNEELTKNFTLFKKYFPQSGYTKFLNKRLQDFLSDVTTEEELKNIVFLNEGNSLHRFIEKEFKNEYVLVDLWATWCSPCIYQFMFKERTNSFLDSNNIKQLFISIDKIEDESHWKKYVTKNRVLGSHILASESLRDEISKLFYNGEDILIPRYILFNKEGKIIDDDLPVPSSQREFEERILKLIKDK